MTSNYNPPSYLQSGTYNLPAKHYSSANNLNNIAPISHQGNYSPSKLSQYGGPQQLNILSPQSTYKAYQFGDYNASALSKDPYQPSASYALSNQNAFSYNKPFAPPSQVGPVSQFVGTKSFVGGEQQDAKYSQFQANQGPKPFNNLDFEQNINSQSQQPLPMNNPQTMFTQKKYAFESSSPHKSNYFNVDKYFENFKDPFDNIDMSGGNLQQKGNTIPKNYGADFKSAYSNNSTLNGENKGTYQNQPKISEIPTYKYGQETKASPTYVSQPAYNGFNKDRIEENELQSRVINEQKQNPPSFSNNTGDSFNQKYVNPQPISEFSNKNSNYTNTEAGGDNSNKNRTNLVEPQFNFSVEQALNKQTTFGEQPKEKNGYTIPNNDIKQLEQQKTAYQQQEQNPVVSQSQNFLKDYHEQKKIENYSQSRAKTDQDDSTIQKSKEYSEYYIQHLRQQKELGYQQFQQDLQQQEFNNQLAQYLKQQAPQKQNILEQLEQKNNKQPQQQKQYKSQTVALFEKTRSKIQSQAFLNKISNQLDSESVYFIKFLVEQITIDTELDLARESLIKSTDFSVQTLFNFFDKKKKRLIDFGSFLEGLENLSIPYIKAYIQKIFNRFVQEGNKQLRKSMINQIFSFAGPKSGVVKEQKKQFATIKRQSNQLNEELKKQVQQVFTHLVNIEKSIQSFKDMQGEEENLLNIFKSIDKKQKGFLNMNDLFEYLNEKGGDFQKEELLGIFKRLNFLTLSGRINFNEFLLCLQREAVVQQQPEQKQIPESNKEEQLKPIKILKEPNWADFKKVAFKGKQKRVE